VRAVEWRIRKLEDRFGSELRPLPLMLVVVARAGWDLALDRDTCLSILEECVVLPRGSFSVVDLCRLPIDLSAGATERFLREHTVEICGARSRVANA
jgi:hypothetical protein